MSRADFGFDMCAKRHGLTAGDLCAQLARRGARHHEGEALAAASASRCPQRTMLVSRPDQAVLWFGMSLTMPAAPNFTTARRCTIDNTPSASTIFPRTSLPA